MNNKSNLMTEDMLLANLVRLQEISEQLEEQGDTIAAKACFKAYPSTNSVNFYSSIVEIHNMQMEAFGEISPSYYKY